MSVFVGEGAGVGAVVISLIWIILKVFVGQLPNPSKKQEPSVCAPRVRPKSNIPAPHTRHKAALDNSGSRSTSSINIFIGAPP